MAEVQLQKIVKRYGPLEVVPSLDLHIPDKSFTVLVGPSGCGKSTLLRMIAGLENRTSGSIKIDGQDVSDEDPSRRGIAMVFQNYALYPHMTVADNIGFSLKLARMPRAEINRRVDEAADILQIKDYLRRKPKELSGGQRQRVAIGRAIVRKPRVFLFDEPLSNLDAALRAQMRLELAELHQRLKTTMIYVTHDQVEAMTMADQIVVLKEGKVQQLGTPLDLYRQPANTFVAQFIGAPKMNLIGGEVAARHGGAQLGIRPEHLQVAGENSLLEGIVIHAEHLGADTIVHVDSAEAGRITMRLDGSQQVQAGDQINLAARPDTMQVFNSSGVNIRDAAHA